MHGLELKTLPVLHLVQHLPTTEKLQWVWTRFLLLVAMAIIIVTACRPIVSECTFMDQHIWVISLIPRPFIGEMFFLINGLGTKLMSYRPQKALVFHKKASMPSSYSLSINWSSREARHGNDRSYMKQKEIGSVVTNIWITIFNWTSILATQRRHARWRCFQWPCTSVWELVPEERWNWEENTSNWLPLLEKSTATWVIANSEHTYHYLLLSDSLETPFQGPQNLHAAEWIRCLQHSGHMPLWNSTSGWSLAGLCQIHTHISSKPCQAPSTVLVQRLSVVRGNMTKVLSQWWCQWQAGRSNLLHCSLVLSLLREERAWEHHLPHHYPVAPTRWTWHCCLQ